ncbi:hypothetical protein BH11BAC7_BH11BAC7_08970 [soil metagenome]
MKRTAAFIPLAVILLITAVVSCKKTPPPAPSPTSQTISSGPLSYIGARNWNTLFYFGTPYDGGCVQPCGFCHATPWQIGYMPNTNDPDNNEALTEISVSRDGLLLVSIDLTGVGNYYVNEMHASQHFNVDRLGVFPQEVINAACDAAGIPHWEGTVGMAPGNYPISIESSAPDARLEIEGVNDGAGDWSWTCHIR